VTDIITLQIEGEETQDELEVPATLVDMLEEDAEGAAAVVGDIALFGMAQRIHGAVHHAEGEVDSEVEAAEEATLDLFEERFGMTFGEATGHDH
jgi:hypothetical protein